MLSRRSFLTLAIGLIPCTPVVALPTLLGDRAPTDLAEVLSVLVGDTNAAAAIGQDALNMYPDLFEAGAIKHAFHTLQTPADDGTPLAAATIRERYQAAVREDFAASRIIEVHGWQLARMEVCLFAFLALDAGSNRQSLIKAR